MRSNAAWSRLRLKAVATSRVAVSGAKLCSARNAWTSFVMTARSSNGRLGSLTSQSATNSARTPTGSALQEANRFVNF